jgi:hypothetical protein
MLLAEFGVGRGYAIIHFARKIQISYSEIQIEVTSPAVKRSRQLWFYNGFFAEHDTPKHSVLSIFGRLLVENERGNVRSRLCLPSGIVTATSSFDFLVVMNH